MQSLIAALKIYFIPEAVIPAVIIGIVTGIVLYLSFKGEINKKVAYAIDAIHQSDWWLVHGGTSPYYYDLDTELQPKKNNKLLSEWYVKAIKRLQKEMKATKLVFGEKDAGPVGALSLKDLIFSRTRIPAVVIRTRRRVYCAAIKGKLQKGDNVIVVTDVITTGGTVQKIAEILKIWNINVVGVVAAFNRSNMDSLEILGQRVEIDYAIDESELVELQNEKLIPYSNTDYEECRV